jgi:GT2 family glycosyltransferase
MAAPARVELPRADNPVASIIVLGWRNAGIIDALESVRANCAEIPYEVIVVLNGADDAVVEVIQQRVSGALVLESSNNLGFGGGCDFAATHARGDYVVFLNDDAIVQPGWLTALVRTAQSETGAAIVGSRMMFPDGRLQEAGAVLWSDGGTWQVGHGADGADNLWRQRRDTAYCSGAGMLVDRRVFVEVNGFDEVFYPAYFEDVDLCLRVHDAGLRVIYEPTAVLVHAQSTSSHEFYRAFLYNRNLQTLRARWAHVLQALPIEPNDHSVAVMDTAAARAEETLLLKLYRESSQIDRALAPALSARQGGFSAGSASMHQPTLRSGDPGPAPSSVDRAPAPDRVAAPERRGRADVGPTGRVNDTLAKLHQFRLDAVVAREYIDELENRLRTSQDLAASEKEANRLLVDEVSWLRKRVAEHEAHESVLLGRLVELQAAIDLRDRELERTKIDLDHVLEQQRLLEEQTVHRLVVAANAVLKTHPRLAEKLAPAGRLVAKRLSRHYQH